MKLTRATIALYMGLVFASGAVLGVLGYRLYTVSTTVIAKAPAPPKPEEFRKQYVTEMQQRLNMSDKQVAQLNAILDETRAQVEETRQKMRPAFQKIHEEQQAKIRKMLTPEQEAEHQKLIKERIERQKQSGHPGPPPGF